MTSPIIVALDYHDIYQVLKFSDMVSPQQCRLKIGTEIFTYAGPSIIRSLHERGFDIFLDLKFHDIPHTITKTVTVAAELGVWMIDLHVSNGKRVMQSARHALVPFGTSAPLLIGITVLTSMCDKDLHDLGISDNVLVHTLRLAQLAKQCKLNGIVCSALEARQIRIHCGPKFIIITPGIRPLNSKIDDQMRVMTPIQAQKTGIDYMVIGRPITQANDPALALASILSELDKVNH